MAGISEYGLPLPPTPAWGSPEPEGWVAPPDPRLPRQFPYRIGQTLTIRRHVPPPPFGKKYQETLTRLLTERWKQPFRTDTHTDWCLRFPPQESTELPPHQDTSTHTLHVVGEIVARPGHRAQLLRCRFDDDPVEGGGLYVAKIFDAAYYSPTHYDGDVTYTADRDYSCEAAAYECLCEAGVNGRYTPKYYGSWTFDMPVPPATTRAVRVILMEYIPGTSMYTHLITERVDAIPIPHRLDLMAETMESICQIQFHGITHMDFEPRNVVVLDAKLDPPKQNGAKPKEEAVAVDQPGAANEVGKAVRPSAAYIIDFNESYVITSPYYRKQVNALETLPMSPADYFWNNPLDNFGCWVPHVYQMRWPAFNGWLKSRWGTIEGYRTPPKWEQEMKRLNTKVEYIPPESIPWPEVIDSGEKRVCFLESDRHLWEDPEREDQESEGQESVGQESESQTTGGQVTGGPKQTGS